MTAFHQKEAHRHAAAFSLRPNELYPTAPPPVEPVVVMSARAQKKFDQLDLDSSGYVATYV